jgi:Holliday junction DNA helicase RuvB
MELEGVLQSFRQRIEQTKTEQSLLEHSLLCGERELTQQIFSFLSTQMQISIRKISAPNVYRPGDIAAILTHLQYGSILYVDEMHRLEKSLISLLESTMRDYVLDLIVGEAPEAKHIKLKLPRFTVIAATSRPTLLSYQCHILFPVEYQIDP